MRKRWERWGVGEGEKQQNRKKVFFRLGMGRRAKKRMVFLEEDEGEEGKVGSIFISFFKRLSLICGGKSERPGDVNSYRKMKYVHVSKYIHMHSSICK